MTDLKTLKDCKDKEEARSEAVKYFKDLEAKRGETYDDGEMYHLNTGELADKIMKHCQIFIKHFFNLSDAELQEAQS